MTGQERKALAERLEACSTAWVTQQQHDAILDTVISWSDDRVRAALAVREPQPDDRAQLIDALEQIAKRERLHPAPGYEHTPLIAAEMARIADGALRLSALTAREERQAGVREEVARYRIALVQIQHGLTKHTPEQIATAALRRVVAREDTERPDADDVLAAAAIMVGTLLGESPDDRREWLNDLVAQQGATFPGAERLQTASEKILREVDDPMSQLGPRRKAVRDTERPDPFDRCICGHDRGDHEQGSRGWCMRDHRCECEEFVRDTEQEPER